MIMKETTLKIEGMTCKKCTTHIKDPHKETEGVKSAVVNFAREIANVEFDPAVTGIKKLKSAVEDTGYRVMEKKTETFEEEDEDIKKVTSARYKMWTAWGFTASIVIWVSLEMFFGIVWPNRTIFDIGMMVLAIVQPGRKIPTDGLIIEG